MTKRITESNNTQTKNNKISIFSKQQPKILQMIFCISYLKIKQKF